MGKEIAKTKRIGKCKEKGRAKKETKWATRKIGLASNKAKIMGTGAGKNSVIKRKIKKSLF